jgi:hypothetical protein
MSLPNEDGGEYGSDSIVEEEELHDVNQEDFWGNTPLHHACIFGDIKRMQKLLANDQVDTVHKDDDNCTPFWMLAHSGDCLPIKWFVASGRDIGDLTEKGAEDEFLGYLVTPLELALALHHHDAARLIQHLMHDEHQTRHEIRLEFGLKPQTVAHLFAIVIFVCDDLLRLKATQSTVHKDISTGRFFSMVTRLPMELQMMICHRVSGSPKDVVLTRDSEPMFKFVSKHAF